MNKYVALVSEVTTYLSKQAGLKPLHQEPEVALVSHSDWEAFQEELRTWAKGMNLRRVEQSGDLVLVETSDLEIKLLFLKKSPLGSQYDLESEEKQVLVQLLQALVQ